MSRDFYSSSKVMAEELIERRRDFHRHPELAFEEVRTAGIVADHLAALGFEVQTGIGRTGVVGMLEGEHPGSILLLRFDMDALPIHEENEVDYVSTNAGVMHACGHDGHTAIGLSVASMLAEHRHEISGGVKFVFQPAEECLGGAKAMIADGVLTDPVPDHAFGMHLWSGEPVGWVGAADGPVMSQQTDWECIVSGAGGHAAIPHQVRDPVVAAAQVVTAIQSVVARNVNPLHVAVVSVTRIYGGNARNVIPGSVTLAGTIRTFLPEVRDLILERLREVATGVAEAMGCEASLSLTEGVKPVVNDIEAAKQVRETARLISDVTEVASDERMTASEDFGEFMADVPGCFFFIGSANVESGINHPHHHPRFDLDERALIIGAEVMASVAARYVLPD